MAADIEYKQNDTWPPTPMTLEAPNAETAVMEPIDLSGAEAVHLLIAMDDAPGGGVVKTAPLTFVDKPTGKVSYTPENPAGEDPADLAVTGDGKVEIEIIWSPTKKQSIPKSGYYTIHVEPKAAA